MNIKLIDFQGKNKKYFGGFIFQTSRHIQHVLLFVVVFLGLLTGSFFTKADQNTYLSVAKIFNNYIEMISEFTFIKYFMLQLLYNLGVVILNFVFGLCAIGFPVPMMFCLIKGVSIGALSAFLYSEHAFIGFVYCLLILYPMQIINILVLLWSGKESIVMSGNILKQLTDKRQKGNNFCDLKMYITRYLIFIILIIATTLVSSVLSVYVVPLFNF